MVGVQFEAQLPQSLCHRPLDGGVDLRDLGADSRAKDRFVGGELSARPPKALIVFNFRWSQMHARLRTLALIDK